MAATTKSTKMTVTEFPLMYQGTLIEIPLNFPKLPDGSADNPTYDPEYRYGWGAYRNPSDMAIKMTYGWRKVDAEEIDAKLPENYRHALRQEGSYLVFGDLVLLKIHRSDYAKYEEEQENRATAHLRNAGRDSLNQLPTVPSVSKNEVILRAE